MILHPDGRVEGTLEELMQFQNLQKDTPPARKPRTRKPIVKFLPTQVHLDIFNFIQEFGPSRAREIAEYFEMDSQTVSNRINVLKTKGLVIGTPGHSTWEVTTAVAEGRLVAQV